MSISSEAGATPTLLVVCNSFPVLSETFIVDHVVGMVSAGWQVTVAANSVDRAGAQRIQAREGIQFQVVELPDFGDLSVWKRALAFGRATTRLFFFAPSQLKSKVAWSCAKQASRLAQIINAVSPSVVHAHFGPNGVVAALATSRPLLVDFHGHDITSWPQRWGWALYRQTLEFACLIAHSRFAADRLEKFGMTGVTRVTIGVDLERFAASNRGDSWSVPLRLVSVGRLVDRKGHDVVLRAFAKLRLARPGLSMRLRIIGSGPDRDAIVALANELGIADWLEGPAPVNYYDMPAAYRAADLLIAASQSTSDGWEEAFCRVAVEAMSCGIPVVATPCGGLPDTVGAGGIISADQGPDSVAAAIADVIDTGSPAFWGARSVASASRFAIDRMREEYAVCTSDARRTRRFGRMTSKARPDLR